MVFEFLHDKQIVLRKADSYLWQRSSYLYYFVHLGAFFAIFSEDRILSDHFR